jgi:hypothetical protein
MANAVCWAIQNGNWSSASTWAGGVIPDTSGTDRVYTNGFTINVDININVALLSNASFNSIVPLLASAIMTSNNTPSGIVTASSTQSGTSPWYAFDGTLSTTRWQSGTTNTGWIKYQFTSAKTIKRYTVMSAGSGLGGGSNGNASSWTFEGSNDDSSWTILDTRTSLNLTDGIPVDFTIANSTAYLYYRLNITATKVAGNNPNIADIQMTESTQVATGGAAGGGFNFNTGGVTAIVGSITLWQGGTITVTNSTGIVTITSSSNLANSTSVSGNIYLDHSGAGDLILTAPNFSVSNPGYGFTMYFLRKSGIGNLTINGNLFGVSGTSACLLISASGNTIINGNLSNSTLGALIAQQGNLIINGNINGSTSSAATITNQSAGTFVINGIVYSGTLNYGVTSTNSFTVNGNVICNSSQPAIYSTSNISITLNGNAYASVLANAITLTTGTVYLKGNMYNVLGRVAIWCPNIFIDNTAVSLWEMSVGGGLTKKLYSADTTPNLPVVGNVRNGITYGPASSLTGTMKVPSPLNVRTGVPTDNTVGSATALEAQDIINYISSSSDDLAKRLRRILTTEEAGNLIKNN